MTQAAIRSSVVTGPTQRTPSTSTSNNPESKSFVYEYACLFTHDIRRKNTKRWQDGYLRFHQFNCRVMVYDQSRNYVGDTHFQSSGADGLEDGDELQLERGGVLVQVAERLSVQETNLTNLLAKRAPKQQLSQTTQRNDSPNISTKTPTRSATATAGAELPKRSPFEIKQAVQLNRAPGATATTLHPTKRRRIEDKHIPLKQLIRPSTSSRTPLTLSNKSVATASEIHLRKSPPKRQLPPCSRPGTSRDYPSDPVYAKSPVHSELPRAKSPPVSTTTDDVLVSQDSSDTHKSTGDDIAETDKASDERKKKTRPLRLATSAPKRKLLCRVLGNPAKHNQTHKGPPSRESQSEVAPTKSAEQYQDPTPARSQEATIDPSIFEDDQTFASPVQEKEADERRPPDPQESSKPLSPKRALEGQQTRPFRRCTSNTSPSKQRHNASLEGSEKIAVPPEKIVEDRPPLQPRTTNIGKRSTSSQNEKGEESKDEDVGAWSREAWDLFGWCPSEKAESLQWTFASS